MQLMPFGSPLNFNYLEFPYCLGIQQSTAIGVPFNTVAISQNKICLSYFIENTYKT